MSSINKINNFNSKKKNLPIFISILAIGIIVMLFPKKSSNKIVDLTKQNDNVIAVSKREYENELKVILSKVKGVGKVDVLIVYKNSANFKNDNLLNSNKQTQENGIISGVIIVCEGADNASVKSELMNIVSNVLDIKLHKVCVLKMQ